MHELGVVFQAIKIVEKVAKENNLTEIESVTVEIGEVSTVIESYLQNCWKWSVEKKSDIICIGRHREKTVMNSGVVAFTVNLKENAIIF